MNSFYNELELQALGFKKLGNNVKISRFARFYNPSSISINSNVRIDDFVIISGEVQINSFVHIGAYSQIVGGEFGVIIEDFVSISSGVKIFASSDDYSGNSLTNPMIPQQYKSITNQKIIIQKHCIIGSNSVVLPTSKVIAFGVSIGALSLIMCPTKPFGIYFGIPAKRIAERSKNILKLEQEFKNTLMGGGRTNLYKRYKTLANKQYHILNKYAQSDIQANVIQGAIA